MRRVVVTGMGIVSSLGNNYADVTASLKQGKSGISFCQEYKDMGMRSHIHGAPKIDIKEKIDRKILRFMGEGAAYNYIAMQEAINDAKLTKVEISNERTGLISGSGGPSTINMLLAWDTIRESKLSKRIGPYMVPRTMSSTNSATLAVPFEIRGVNYSISSACSTSAHCIGNAMELIMLDKQDIIFAGGGEELHWTLSCLFDAMPALSSGRNDTPEKASRAFDADRDGFVIAGGGGILVLEELEHAKARGATIYAELTGYCANSDGYDMVQPSGEGAFRCMKTAMKTARNPVGYINAHGTSTPVGDAKELSAIKQVFASDKMPYIGSTKSLSGHSLGAAGVHEAIYSLSMLREGYLAESVNIETLDEAATDMPIVQSRKDIEVNTVLSNSFGFGGTNACLIFEKFEK